MKRRTMAGNAALLSVFSIIAKVISALYRVPLTSVLGAEGMGMYQLVFSIYALILALTTGGIPVAVSRLTSENNTLKKDSRIVLKNALLSVVGTSVVLAAFLCVLSGFVARIQGNEGVKSGYYVIAPAVVFVGALSMFRGWFQGNNDVIPTAVSGLFEQVFKLAFGLTLAKILSKYGVIYGVIGALSGVMISEFVALIYIVITYFSRGKIYKINAVESCDKDVRNAILKTSVVFAIAGFIIPFSQFIDGILIVNILKSVGRVDFSCDGEVRFVFGHGNERREYARRFKRCVVGCDRAGYRVGDGKTGHRRNQEKRSDRRETRFCDFDVCRGYDVCVFRQNHCGFISAS